MKQAEREDTWARVNAQAESVFKDDESMKGFLNFMANCTPQSTRNLLILYEQNTEITIPAPSINGRKPDAPSVPARKGTPSLPIRNTPKRTVP